MFAILMALVLSVVVAGVVWLLIGTRLALHSDPHQNEVLNLGAYVALAFLPVFLVVWIWAP